MTISGVDVAGAVAGLLDGSTFGWLCEQAASPITAAAAAVLRVNDRCRGIDSGRPRYSAMPDSWWATDIAGAPTGAMEVTVGNMVLMTATPAKPVARPFAVMGCPLGGPKSTLRLPAGAMTQLFTAFDYAHERPMAGSVGVSTASIRGGKGAQDG
ncbi:hypothetical protein MSIM_47140 [Mycobacterium simiae]|nr:hypothetical protein MSIM_47140 [Mycobacterium simiae]